MDGQTNSKFSPFCWHAKGVKRGILPCSGTSSYLQANAFLQLAADEMATPEQHEYRSPFTILNRKGYVLVERARPSGSFFYCDSSASSTGNLVLGELQSIVNQRFPSIDLSDQVFRDSSKLVGSGNYGLVYEGTMGTEHKRVAVKAVRYGDKTALPALKVSRLFVILVAVVTPENAPESAKRSIRLVQAQAQQCY